MADADAAVAAAESVAREAEEHATLYQAETAELRKALVTAERNRDRFRMALFVYLQERDGPAGTNAPTKETLALIRDILENRDNDS